jgi:hypothetical protein
LRMNTTSERLSSARRYLDAHRAAMGCRDFEDRIAEAVRVFDLVHELVLRRRERVYRGVAEPNPAMDEGSPLFHYRGGAIGCNVGCERMFEAQERQHEREGVGD